MQQMNLIVLQTSCIYNGVCNTKSFSYFVLCAYVLNLAMSDKYTSSSNDLSSLKYLCNLDIQSLTHPMSVSFSLSQSDLDLILKMQIFSFCDGLLSAKETKSN